MRIACGHVVEIRVLPWFPASGSGGEHSSSQEEAWYCGGGDLHIS